jgi:hypothetical protein
MHPPPQEIPGGPHISGIDIGLGEHAATEQDGNLMGIDPVVFRFATVDRLHVEGMPEDERNVLLSAEVGEPVPGEHAFDGDHNTVAIGGEDLE